MRIKILFLAIPVWLLHSCLEKEEYTYNKKGEIISVIVNDEIKVLFKEDLNDFSIVKNDSSSTVIYKFLNEKFREVDSIKESNRVTQILFNEKNSLRVYKSTFSRIKHLNIILDISGKDDLLLYTSSASNSFQDYTQYFLFINDSLKKSESSFYEISDKEEKVLFNLPSLNEELIEKTSAQVNVYDKTIDNYNSRIINNRVFISDTFLIEVLGNLKTNNINVPLYKNTDMRVTLFNKDDDQFYTTYLYNVNREHQFYNRAKKDYQILKSFSEDVSFEGITDDINKALIDIDGFSIQKDKMIISENIMRRLRNM